MRPALRSRSISVLLAALALGAAACYGAWRAAEFVWCSDDAFISFRYARNLNDGLGLVFNAGERVEGYTNFSWTMLVALAMRFGADPVVFAQAAGIACFVGTIATVAWAARRALGPDVAFVPVAAVGLALHEHAQVFATGGLETSFFTLLATATVCVAVLVPSPRGLLASGGLGVLATMTRPDGILLYGIAGLAGLACAVRARRWAPLLAVCAPGLLVYLPYWLWRYAYYGWPFPNTFYAKSAAQAYPQQGLYYIGLYLACYWVLSLAPAGVLVGLTRARTRGLALAIAGSAGIYLAFVGWVGGDFMFGRFLVPVTPLAYVGIELLRARLRQPVAGWVLLAVVAGATLLRRHPGEEITRLPGGVRGVVEERLNYTPASTAAMRQAGEYMRGLFAGHEVRVVIMGAQAIWAYYGEFDVVIEGCTGLTDEHIAHLPIAERAAVGHEKSVLLDPDYLLRRRVHFSLHLDPGSHVAGHYQHIRFGPAAFGLIITYDRELMRALAGRSEVEFVDFERHLDDYIARMAELPDATVAADYAKFERFYFAHDQDPEREAAFRARLGPR